MGGKTANTTTARAARGEAEGFSETFAAQLLMGGLFAVGFYGAVAVMPEEWTFFRRYFCSHPLEYATTGLFFIAMGTLLLKFVQHSSERSQLKGAVAKSIAGSNASQRELDDAIQQCDGSAKRTWFVRRLRDASAFVRTRGTSTGIEDHLRYLGELASDQLHRSYAFVRTITWAVPILGFLGTVIGITMAIANVTPEQLDSSLGEVTGGLAVAFDTTALALGLSILLVFASFLIERSEQQLLAEIEDFSIRHLPGVFGVSSSNGDAPIRGIEPATAKILADALDAVATRQAAIWEEQLGELRTRWESLLQIAENQGQLIRLEEQLHTNLEAIRTSETFDQTLNNLTAAVHLLSTRTNATAPQPHRRAA
jgi:biopolymer transport protein ExbB/TolQ